MKKTLLATAVLASPAFPPQAAPRGPQRPHIEPLMQLRPVSEGGDAYELLIYGDIGDSWWGESVTAQSVAQQLNQLDASVATINVRINSYGGSVADGLAIYNALKRHKATKAVTVDGVAMSSASLIAMAGDTVTMPPTSILMIHAPWGGCYGNAKEMRQYADVLDTFSESMADAYMRKSGKSREDVLALLQDGEDHYYTGEEAVAEGFADAVGSDDDDQGEPDENARAYASLLLDRISARGAPARYAGLAVAAALRGAPRKPAAAQPAAPIASSSLTVTVDASAAAAALRDALTPPNPPAATAANTPPADAGNPSGDTPMNLTEEQKKALAQRRGAIRAAFAPFLARTDLNVEQLRALQDECLDNDDVTPDAAGQRLLQFLGQQQDATPTGGPRAEPGRQDEVATYREGAIQAVLNRHDPGKNKLDEKSKDFRGMTLMDMARDSVERAGRRTRGMSRNEIAVLALQSTSDFPYILENVITKALRAGYERTQRTFVPWTRQATLPDFKEVSRVQLSGAPNLKRVVEGGEYEYGQLGDSAEKYRVQKYGRIVHITWETIINDDLDALTRIPTLFGSSAADLESDIVYGILNGNPKMADNVDLFHSSHGNLASAGVALIDAVNPDPSVANPLAAMRAAMLLQKGIEGRYITVRPRFLLVPPELEEAALKVTNAAIVAARGNDANVLGPSLVPIVEPRLHDGSATAWYGVADPNQVDTIEYAYLEGNEGVFTETKAGFEVDGLQVKCRHVFGAKAIDHRGLYKNPGSASPSPYPGTGD
ncbi:ClpP-like prohead protease/major capsid protein fusion protein [Pseudoxanthomonas sp. SGT-18]|uniref:ClpP-like prohead protease/major capsid protein fusion protein n=1 Tax=Pseudoxanthomonas sp. SGT-18 TaxID=2493087 RepID=UPI000F62B406|nr:ClpP-like prohead protease/major capsid protein fusion protein [Pseudoxanthomonas sp. SGT-18]